MPNRYEIPLAVPQPAHGLLTVGSLRQNAVEEAREKLALAIASYRHGQRTQALDSLTNLLPQVAAFTAFDLRASSSGSLDALALAAQIRTYLGLLLPPEEAAKSFKYAVLAFDKVWAKLEELTSPPPWSDYGIALMRVERRDEAIQKLKMAANFDDATPEALSELGRVLYSEHRHEEALALLERASEQDSRLPQVHRTIGEIHAKRGHPTEAAAAYLKAASVIMTLAEDDQASRLDALEVVRLAVSLTPANALALVMEGEILYRLNQPDAALESLGRAAALAKPGEGVESSVLALTGDCLRLQGRHREALDLLSRALEADRDNSWARLSRGEVLRCLGRYTEAEDDINAAIIERPGNPWALTSLGLLLNRRQHYKEARAYFQRAIAVWPGCAHSFGGLAEALLGLNDPAAARGEVERGLALVRAEPGGPAEALPWLSGIKAQILAALGSRTEAADLLAETLHSETLQSYPGMAWIREIYIDILLKLDRHSEALEEIERLPTPAQLEGGIAERRAGILLKLGRYAEALADLERAMQRTGASNRTVGAKARILSEMGDFEGACELLRGIRVTDKNQAWLLGHLGWAFQNLGRAGEQLGVYEEALKMAPDDPWLMKGRANALRMLGQKDKAQGAYGEVLLELEKTCESAFTLCLSGWCYYGLERYSDAMPHYIQAFNYAGDILAAQLDFALILLHTGDGDAAKCEYESTLDLLLHKAAITDGKRCGLLRVAIFDLQQAAREKPFLRSIREAAAIEDMLRRALDQVASTLPTELDFVRARLEPIIRESSFESSAPVS